MPRVKFVKSHFLQTPFVSNSENSEVQYVYIYV